MRAQGGGGAAAVGGGLGPNLVEPCEGVRVEGALLHGRLDQQQGGLVRVHRREVVGQVRLGLVRLGDGFEIYRRIFLKKGMRG